MYDLIIFTLKIASDGTIWWASGVTFFLLPLHINKKVVAGGRKKKLLATVSLWVSINWIEPIDFSYLFTCFNTIDFWLSLRFRLAQVGQLNHMLCQNGIVYLPLLFAIWQVFLSPALIGRGIQLTSPLSSCSLETRSERERERERSRKIGLIGDNST